MGRNKSEFLGAFGKGFQIFKVIVDMVLELGGGDSDLSSLLSDKTKVRKIAEIIVGPKKVEQTEFSVWKTVKLGTGLKNAVQFRSAIKRAGMKINDRANHIMGKQAFVSMTEEVELDLVNVSGRELGFTKTTAQHEIYACAIKLGLKLCPNEVGPQLRLQYQNQPLGEWIRIGMEPISDLHGNLFAFYIEHDNDGLWLHGNDAHPVFMWNADCRWVFVRPRK